MFKNLKEKHGHFFESKQPNAPTPSERGQDLTSILDRSQRADLTVLVAEIVASMRIGVLENFENSDDDLEKSSAPSTPKIEQDEDEKVKELGDAGPPLPPRPSDSSPVGDKGRRMSKSEMKKNAVKTRAKKTALSHFEDWRDSVLLRIGEVVNKDDDSQAKPQEKEKEPVIQSEDLPLAEDTARMEKLAEIYPPVESPLAQLPKATRLLILHSLLLLLLSLEHYNAYSRVLMLYTTSSLGIDIKVLNDDEVKVARGLLDTALALSDPEANQPPKKSDNSRKWKVGVASVAGAALIGITGGLAAPLVAAGIGTMMGGLGLGATAAAGYLGVLASSGVVVGGLFGAYGGRMTGRMMDKYAREVEDFAFIPIRGSRKQTVKESDAARQDHRLRVTIGVTGWVTEESNFIIPWKVIGADSEVFALRWETESLMNLGNAISSLVTSAA
ncbi:hypothetical protein N7454_009021 [Penicillium verhagenii]|nr:hypothetical protein N7454_009021 [Penicillium verhagenii]